jgi:hypothetical protein
MKQPSFLTRRGLHFWFQCRMPLRLRATFGRSPLRLRLPADNPRDAVLYARSLATITDIRFRMHDEGSIDDRHATETLYARIATALNTGFSVKSWTKSQRRALRPHRLARGSGIP